MSSEPEPHLYHVYDRSTYDLAKAQGWSEHFAKTSRYKAASVIYITIEGDPDKGTIPLSEWEGREEVS